MILSLGEFGCEYKLQEAKIYVVVVRVQVFKSPQKQNAPSRFSVIEFAFR
jgi:hypothetical protein